MSYLDSLSKIEDLNNGTVVFYSPTVWNIRACMNSRNSLTYGEVIQVYTAEIWVLKARSTF